ncbi:MAG TPA: GNAT family N-acetyltransferase [Usitatibacter sp.]|jgi:putative acetyltransferase|nr:GNAT family N-acetyltransferase [Usitatibacter sp.]
MAIAGTLSGAARVAIETIDQPEALALVGELDALLEPLYPPESRHGLNVAALRAKNVFFVVARDEKGQPMGCGAVMHSDGFAELKRMYVRATARKRGVGAAIIGFLEQHAADHGFMTIRLETGTRQLDALSFYEGMGYARRGPFGAYRPDPLSIFMEKMLIRP